MFAAVHVVIRPCPQVLGYCEIKDLTAKKTATIAGLYQYADEDAPATTPALLEVAEQGLKPTSKLTKKLKVNTTSVKQRVKEKLKGRYKVGFSLVTKVQGQKFQVSTHTLLTMMLVRHLSVTCRNSISPG